MLSSPQTASATLPTSSEGSMQARRADDLTYQGVTLVAMLMLLASLWVF